MFVIFLAKSKVHLRDAMFTYPSGDSTTCALSNAKSFTNILPSDVVAACSSDTGTWIVVVRFSESRLGRESFTVGRESFTVALI